MQGTRSIYSRFSWYSLSYVTTFSILKLFTYVRAFTAFMEGVLGRAFLAHPEAFVVDHAFLRILARTERMP